MNDAPQSSSTGSRSVRQFDDLKLAAENFRRAMIQSGATSHVKQSLYMEQLRALECALNPLNNYRDDAQGSPDCGDDESRMEKISALIARLQSTLDQWGDTCVYIRRGGLSWGAVALNRRSDDEKHGVFDLQAQHDRDMLARLEQIERLKKDRDEWRQKVWDAEAEASSVPSTHHETPK